MAIVHNFWLKGASKKLAGAVIYEAMGQTRARQLASSVTNPRTEAQMNQRIRWANAVAFYRANASWMKYAFENKKTNQSEYNKFMSVNVTTSPIALTKQAAAAGACVVAPYIITQGSLPSIEWQDTTSQVKSNIYLPPSFVLTVNTTVGEFAQALIATNPAMREGDQLSLVRFTQMTNSMTGYPYIIVRKYEVLLKSDSQALLNDFIPVDYVQAPGSAQDNAIFVAKENRQGGFAMILSRTIAGKTYVSTQSVIIVNNESLIGQYSSPAAIAAAIASYGESADAFLSTVSAAAATEQPVALTINYANFPSGILTAGSQTPSLDMLSGQEISLVFSDNLPEGATISAFATTTSSINMTMTNVSVTRNVVSFTFPEPSTGQAAAHVTRIVARVDGTDYEIKFAPASSYIYSGGGME